MVVTAAISVMLWSQAPLRFPISAPLAPRTSAPSWVSLSLVALVSGSPFVISVVAQPASFPLARPVSIMAPLMLIVAARSPGDLCFFDLPQSDPRLEFLLSFQSRIVAVGFANEILQEASVWLQRGARISKKMLFLVRRTTVGRYPREPRTFWAAMQTNPWRSTLWNSYGRLRRAV